MCVYIYIYIYKRICIILICIDVHICIHISISRYTSGYILDIIISAPRDEADRPQLGMTLHHAVCDLYYKASLSLYNCIFICYTHVSAVCICYTNSFSPQNVLYSVTDQTSPSRIEPLTFLLGEAICVYTIIYIYIYTCYITYYHY